MKINHQNCHQVLYTYDKSAIALTGRPNQVGQRTGVIIGVTKAASKQLALLKQFEQQGVAKITILKDKSSAKYLNKFNEVDNIPLEEMKYRRLVDVKQMDAVTISDVENISCTIIID